ncbi:MAG: RNA pyrophosphohydrolase [Halieaceae bacterium]|jgi:putative (di)nucleoside polyphosphate hydrolase|nr:RNA pyrophosphohydrolase [Halieaceae bacterium]
MLDAQGFRPNVGIVIANDAGRLLWARRVGGRDAWQFPQGGIAEGEKPEEALFRELKEEVGLDEDAVEVLGCTRGWLRYRLPKRYQRKGQSPVCVGQKQKWFLLRLLVDDSSVILDDNPKPEFDHWQWVSYWYPLNQVVYFKREVYRRALRELAAPLIRFTGNCAVDAHEAGRGDH